MTCAITIALNTIVIENIHIEGGCSRGGVASRGDIRNRGDINKDMTKRRRIETDMHCTGPS